MKAMSMAIRMVVLVVIGAVILLSILYMVGQGQDQINVAASDADLRQCCLNWYAAGRPNPIADGDVSCPKFNPKTDDNYDINDLAEVLGMNSDNIPQFCGG